MVGRVPYHKLRARDYKKGERMKVLFPKLYKEFMFVEDDVEEYVLVGWHIECLLFQRGDAVGS